MDDQAEAAVAEVESWADSLEQTGHYFHRLNDMALALYAQPMPEHLRDRLTRSIHRIQRMARAMN